jgi:hypothetical protein
MVEKVRVMMPSEPLCRIAVLVFFGSLAWAVLILALCARDRWRGR